MGDTPIEDSSLSNNIVFVENARRSEENTHPPAEPTEEIHFAFNASKAGMAAPTTAQINTVIQSKLKNTDYYRHQADKHKHTQIRSDQALQKIKAVNANPAILKPLRQQFEAFTKFLKTPPPLHKHWVHFDLDMFYVAVELKERPELVNLPVAVGSSIISTSNYVARGFGVRSAMPTHIAKILCPQLVLLPINMEKYRAVSQKFLAVLLEYDHNCESMGLDEGRIELSEYLSLNKLDDSQQGIEAVISEAREKINQATGLTASAGYAANPFLAKICSEKNKPNGQFYLPKTVAAITEFVDKLEVRKLPGVGPQTEDLLKCMDFQTAKDIKDRLFDLYITFGPKARFTELAEKSYGLGRVDHKEKKDRLSVSMVKTIAPTRSYEVLEGILKEQSQALAEVLVEEKKLACRVGIRAKTQTFKLIDRSTAMTPCADSATIYSAAQGLLRALPTQEPIRLIGLHLHDFKSSSTKGQIQTLQKLTFKEPSEKVPSKLTEEEIEKELDDLEAMFTEKLVYSEDEMDVSPNIELPKPQNQTARSHKQQPQSFQSENPSPMATFLQASASPKLMPSPSANILCCPVCSHPITNGTFTSVMNKHIDQCLSLQTSRPTLPVDTEQTTKTPKGPVSRSNTANMNNNGQSAKKSSSRGHKQVPIAKKSTTIEAFFKKPS